MAITKTTDTDQELILKVTNGDLGALREVKKKWKFKNVEDIIRFALAVMVQSDDSTLGINKESKNTILSPNEELIEKDTSNISV